MNTISLFRTLCFTAVAVALFTACSEESTTPDPVIDEEVITRVQLTAKDSATGITTSFEWVDADGPGGAAPTRIDTIDVSHDRTYECRVVLYGGNGATQVVLNPAIVAEADHHQFFYTFARKAATATITDKDSRNLPLGLEFMMHVKATSFSDALTMELSHFENASDKNGTLPSEETDVSVTFPVVIR